MLILKTFPHRVSAPHLHIRKRVSQVQTIRVILLLCLGVSAGLIFVDKAPLLCSEMEPGNTERPPMKTLRIIIRSFFFLRSNFFWPR